jgi:hypothetical protein
VRLIYEELSALANRTAGRFCAKKRIPAIHTNRGAVDSEEDTSTPVTDPFGSAVDFAMQRQLVRWLSNNTGVKTEADLCRVLDATAYAREVKPDVERASRRRGMSWPCP